MKVFLGGTCNETTWRETLISMLTIDYYNPIVDDWTPDCLVEEIKQRKLCDFCLYVITPKMTGVYSIAEVVDDSNKQPDKTVFAYLKKDGTHAFEESQLNSLDAVAKLIVSNGASVFTNLKEVALYLNNQKPPVSAGAMLL